MIQEPVPLIAPGTEVVGAVDATVVATVVATLVVDVVAAVVGAVVVAMVVDAAEGCEYTPTANVCSIGRYEMLFRST